MTKYEERVAHIEKLLLIQSVNIDTPTLRDACIPDLLRPLCWRLFLGYLPKERQEWQQVVSKQRSVYKTLVSNLIESRIGCDEGNESVASDHPLTDDKNSEWAKFFADNDVLIQINKDIRRLRPEIDFFQRKTNYPLKEGQGLSERLYALEEDSPTSSLAPGEEFHWQVVERILFIYSKVNAGVKYVQGMNEIIGPIYYVLASDPDKEWAESAEADTFYCFQHLMSELKDNFIKSLDSSSCGIEWTLAHFSQLFESFEPELYKKIVIEQDIKPQFYAFRWLSLLLSQEYSLPDLITLWDSVFASTNRLEATEYICLAMLENIKADLFAGDFGQNMRLLQNYPVVDVLHLVSRAYELQKTAKRTPESDSGSSQRSTPRFWNKQRFSAMVSDAKERLSTYARRQTNKIDGSISYRPGI